MTKRGAPCCIEMGWRGAELIGNVSYPGLYYRTDMMPITKSHQYKWGQFEADPLRKANSIANDKTNASDYVQHLPPWKDRRRYL